MSSKGSQYLRIKNWEKFQHADATKRGRDPIWIKNYTRLLHDDDYLELTPGERAVLHGLWLLYAAKGQRAINGNTARLTRELGMRVTSRQIDALVQAGFIESCQDSVKTESSLEEIREEEKDHKAFVGELIDRSLRSVG